MKEQLAECIRQWMLDNEMTQAEAAVFLETRQPRVNLIVNKKLDTISLGALVSYVELLGFKVKMEITQ
ncbi:HTH DNA binding protein [Pseudomonas phage vB_PpuM-NoPa]|uniref:HTH DNA binding protein n=4 Tax=Tartuvirus TaxID=3424912 RepID=A0AAX4MXU1_9CAUD